MFALPISLPHTVLKALFYNQNSPKMKLFLQKNAKFLSAGAPPPDLVPPAAGALPSDPKATPHCEFLATHLAVGMRIVKLENMYKG